MRMPKRIALEKGRKIHICIVRTDCTVHCSVCVTVCMLWVVARSTRPFPWSGPWRKTYIFLPSFRTLRYSTELCRDQLKAFLC